MSGLFLLPCIWWLRGVCAHLPKILRNPVNPVKRTVSPKQRSRWFVRRPSAKKAKVVVLGQALGSVQPYRPRNPHISPLWQCLTRHFTTFCACYEAHFQSRYGFLRPIIPEVVGKFLDFRFHRFLSPSHHEFAAPDWVRHGFGMCGPVPDEAYPKAISYQL